MAASISRKNLNMNKFIFILFCLPLLAESEMQTDCKPAEKMDHAMVTIINNITKIGVNNLNISVTSITSECHTCDLQTTASVSYNSSCTILLDTRWFMRLSLFGIDYNTSDTCGENGLSKHFKEYGRYNIYIELMKDRIICKGPFLMNDPDDSNMPVYIMLGSFVVAAALFVLGMKCYRGDLFSKLLIQSGNEHLIDPTKSIGEDTDGIKTESSKRNKAGLRKRMGSHVKSSATRGQSSYASQDLGSMQTNINPADTPENKKPKKERLKSLDTFRGISIIVMIFVNYGGGKYWFFKHSKWNGLTIADLVFPCRWFGWFMMFNATFNNISVTSWRLSLTVMCFVNYGGGGYWFFNHSDWNGLTVADLVMPWFVFIMGTSMAYSYTSLLRSNTPKYKIFWKIFKRSCILFLLGLVINSQGCNAVVLSKFRIPGVLQRFAGTYLITATVHMFFAKLQDPNAPIRTNPFRDITDYILEWIINVIFLVLYCVFTFALDVPNCPKGYLGPGGLSEHGQHKNCTGGAAGYIDRVIFGSAHLYQSPTSMEIYKNTIAYDPEGLLGTLTSCVICFLGLQAGKILMTYKNRRQRVKRFLIWGVVLCLIAGILCKFSKNDGWMPVCKNLWSISFIFCTGGFAFILLAFCYLAIDEWKIWNGAPFYYPGMNSILLYMGHELLHNNFPINWHVAPEHWNLLLVDTYGTVIWLVVAFYCYRRSIFFVI